MFYIKVSKVTALNTQQVCGCSTKAGARKRADKIEERLFQRYAGKYSVKREFCSYGGSDMGYHFTLL